MLTCQSGRGAARLARLHGVQEVGGSNPLAPTSGTSPTRNRHIVRYGGSLCYVNDKIKQEWLLVSAALCDVYADFIFSREVMNCTPSTLAFMSRPLESFWNGSSNAAQQVPMK